VPAGEADRLERNVPANRAFVVFELRDDREEGRGKGGKEDVRQGREAGQGEYGSSLAVVARVDELSRDQL
jgi:hypothetical protein